MTQTENTLNSIIAVKAEIKSIEKTLAAVSVPMPRSAITGMPRSNAENQIELYAEKREEYYLRLTAEKEKLLVLQLTAENIIASISDNEVRAIVRMRYVEGVRWDDIAQRLHLERTTPAKKMRRYLRKNF